MTRTRLPKELKRAVYDEAGERIIRGLPPGLYTIASNLGYVVRIDEEHRARMYRDILGGASGPWQPYEGHAVGLSRCIFEPWMLDSLGFPVPDRGRGWSIDEAVRTTPWAYEAPGRRP